MSQPWRPSRGTGASRWGNADRPNATQSVRPQVDTTPRRAAGKLVQRDEGIIGQGMRSANLRPLRENKMDFSSPSRGELTPGRSLTDYKAQEEFREHLEERVTRYQASYPDELGIIVANNQQQKDALDLILLEFRKLREGIISSSRADNFAVEVYETSAKLALLDKNIPQIASILPHLVKTLHLSPESIKKADPNSLEAGLRRLAITDRKAAQLDTRARFLSYYLLHLVCHMEDAKAFQHLLRDTVSFGASVGPSDKISYLNPHILFAMHIFHCYIRNDYATTTKIMSNPRSYDKFAWVVVRSARHTFQAKAWQTVKASYMVVEDKVWLAHQLQLEDEEQLSTFLKKENWDLKVDNKGAIMLKKG